MRPRSAEIMVDHLLSRPDMVEALKASPEKVLRQVAQETVVNFPLGDSPALFKQVILFLGSTVIVVALGTIALAFWRNSGETPESLVALGSVALGALAGLLAPAPAGR